MYGLPGVTCTSWRSSGGHVIYKGQISALHDLFKEDASIDAQLFVLIRMVITHTNRTTPNATSISYKISIKGNNSLSQMVKMYRG